MSIREARTEDYKSIWPIFHDIVEAGETVAHSKGVTEDEAHRFWMQDPRKTYVFEKDGRILGAYFLQTNQAMYATAFIWWHLRSAARV